VEVEDEIEKPLYSFPVMVDMNKSFVSSFIPESIPDDREEIIKEDKIILIIEDDTNFAKSLIDFTHKQGYKAIVAVRGDEGIELAKKHLPTGILLDIQLPVKSGWEVMEELKKDPVTRQIPVHMMSSLEAKNESLIKGAVNFIHKPFAYESMGDVFKKIEQVLSKKNKKVLIIEENEKHAKALSFFLESYNVKSDIKENIEDSISALQGDIDCVVLDMGIPDAKAYEMLEKVKQDGALDDIPIIIFTGKSLSLGEEQRIKKYADSIVVKTAQSYQRILDEVSLFLHLVESNLKPTKSSFNKKLAALDDILKDKKVLIVDDDVRNIFSLSKTMEKMGISVLTAIDGREALKVLGENADIDVVLLDMMMPELDGYQTAQKIRENPKWKYLPIIAITAKAMTGDREKCIKAGASDYITKPVDIDQLLSLLRVWLYEKN
ncbi:MAG: response regulator, partial [Ferruginibacter sp.]